ncbi:Oxysterol-binding protein OBPa [Coemansia sp. RSA 2611]|nr:Oxysterol-binding protein OBPa [Coemansia sp. RSA 2611]
MSTVTCKHSDLVFDVEFKTKGILWGSYNQIAGKIRRLSTGEVLYDISGNWQTAMYITDRQSGKPELLFDSASEHVVPQIVACAAEQEPNESRNLWKHVTKAIRESNLNDATTHKTAIEEAQRSQAKEREATGERFKPRFFQLEIDGHYHPQLMIKDIPEDAAAAKEKLTEWIFARPDGSMQDFSREEDDPVVLAAHKH